MEQITKITSLSSGLYPEFGKIQTIEIEDKPFAEGAFGEVYHCLSINKAKPTNPQVIKIFKKAVKGWDKKSHDTIQKLQKKLAQLAQGVKAKENRLLTEKFPAFLGMPQFSFKGKFKGQEVLGYSANNLIDLGFFEFKDILEDPVLAKQYQRKPQAEKMLIAYHLASAFDELRKMLYIHADFKADALFVNPSNNTCAIIDYDSGVVVGSPNDKPSSWGTRQDWLAPEIHEQLCQFSNNQGSVEVDLYSDIWSVAMGIHYLLFTCHPLFYLKEVSKRSIDGYFKQFKWPDVKHSFTYFSPIQKARHPKYRDYIQKHVPKIIREKFDATINNGYEKPAFRTSYSAWKNVLQSTQKPPTILAFQASETILQQPRPVLIQWKVENATTISLGGKDVSGRSSIKIEIRKDTVLKLTAVNSIAKVAQKITIKTSKKPPQIHSFQADRNTREDARPIVLTWNISNAETVHISPSVGLVKKKQVEVKPLNDTVYTLTATSYFGVKTQAKIALKTSKKPPQIHSFQADRNTREDARPIVLTWNISNAETVHISPSVGLVKKNQVEVKPLNDTVYTLTATSYFGIKTQAKVTVKTSKKPPIIHLFQSDRSTREDARPLLLTWNVTNVETIHISPNVGLAKKKQVEVKPLKDTVYTLIATSYFGVKTQASVAVKTSKKPPNIVFFRSNIPVRNSSTDKVVLLWDVQNAQSVLVQPEVGKITGKKHTEVNPLRDTKYKLTAVSYFGIASTKELLLQVSKKAPSIARFDATKRLVYEGRESELIWDYDPTCTGKIDQGIGKIRPSGSSSVYPKDHKTYTLTIEDPFGNISTGKLEIKVVKPISLKINPVPLNVHTKLAIPKITLNLYGSKKLKP